LFPWKKGRYIFSIKNMKFKAGPRFLFSLETDLDEDFDLDLEFDIDLDFLLLGELELEFIDLE
jgi:hypothetical protein